MGSRRPAPQRHGSGRTGFATGGNAVDALAAATALTVAYPHQCSIGGDCIALVGLPDGTVHAIYGIGRYSASFSAADLEGPPVCRLSGPLTVTVPGAVAAWQTMADTWGAKSLVSALSKRLPSPRKASPSGMSPSEVHRPRWIAGSSQIDGDQQRAVCVGAGMPRQTDEALAASGFHIVEIAALDDEVGHAQVIQIGRDGQFIGGSDPRADGAFQSTGRTA